MYPRQPPACDGVFRKLYHRSAGFPFQRKSKWTIHSVNALGLRESHTTQHVRIRKPIRPEPRYRCPPKRSLTSILLRLAWARSYRWRGSDGGQMDGVRVSRPDWTRGGLLKLGEQRSRRHAADGTKLFDEVCLIVVPACCGDSGPVRAVDFASSAQGSMEPGELGELFGVYANRRTEY